MPNDLEMEHAIKDTKTMITAMGANKTEKSVLHGSMSVTGVSESLSAYDESSESIAHTKKSSARDEGIMLTDLKLLKPFNCNPLHEPHPSFTEIRKSIREKLNINDLFQWLTKHKRRFFFFFFFIYLVIYSMNINPTYRTKY